MQRLTQLRSAIAGLLTFAISPAVMAQEQCEADTCPPGYTCEEASYDNCQWDCPEDGECTVSECETVQYTSCLRAACESDADCGPDMVCHTVTTNCATPSPPPCEPGGACPELPQIEPCENTEFQQCTPRSELPCEVNNDCGEGFDCVPAVVCTCSGTTPTEPSLPSGGTSAGSRGDSGGGSDAADAPGAPMTTAPTPIQTAPLPEATALPPGTSTPGELPLPPDDCTCEPSGTNYCQMQNIECETDDDCPSDWSCVQSPGACWADSEGNTGCSEGSSQCYPPGNPGGTPTPTAPGVPVTDPGAGEGDNGGVSEPTPELPPVPEPAPTGGGGRPHGGGGSAGGLFGLMGCSVDDNVGATSSGSGWAALALGLGAALLRRRRR